MAETETDLRGDPYTPCHVCDGKGFTMETYKVCCGNLDDAGKCRVDCLLPEQVEMVPCDHCSASGREPEPFEPD